MGEKGGEGVGCDGLSETFEVKKTSAIASLRKTKETKKMANGQMSVFRFSSRGRPTVTTSDHYGRYQWKYDVGEKKKFIRHLLVRAAATRATANLFCHGGIYFSEREQPTSFLRL